MSFRVFFLEAISIQFEIFERYLNSNKNLLFMLANSKFDKEFIMSILGWLHSAVLFVSLDGKIDQ